MKPALSHWSEKGNLRMIDVPDKKITKRTARAVGKILIKQKTMDLIKSKKTPKGDIFAVSKTAGINAVKQTQFLIPLCHNLGITHCEIDFKINKNAVEVITTVRTKSFTGVEMEALTGTAVTLLTLYDMLKPVDKSMVISEIMLLSKSGGKSGKWLRK
ncbi:cyclic pyranopterin monophosphate synthase MoaC [bacterium]|nr:cyclic pyranopterin monophosphate synthase MoaC [bacterium]